MSENERIVIIGGGIIGLSLAYELLRRGRAVHVIERSPHGGGATRASGGMLAPISEAEIEPAPLLALGQDSLRRYPEFVRGIEQAGGTKCGLETEGTIWVAIDRDDHEELAHLAETLRLKQLDHRLLSAEEMLGLEPHLSARVVSGLLVPQDHHVDPRALSHALVRAVMRLEGSVELGVTVREVVETGGKVARLVGVDGEGNPWERRCSTVLVCAGPWTGTGENGVTLPLPPLGLRPVKGQLLRLKGERLLRHVVRHPEGYLVPRADGELLVGATMEELGFDETATAGGALDLLRHAWRVLPGLYELELVEISVGLRSAVDDQLPLIGPTDVGGLYLATGHFRNGILLAPATAHHLVAQIIDGEVSPVIEPFAPARVLAGGPAETH